MDDFEIAVPPELEHGAYANAFTVWYTRHDFVLDFAVQRPYTLDDAHLLAARVRLPATLVFELIRTLNDALSRYEQEFSQ